MSRLVQGREALMAMEASAIRAAEVGADQALAELGFDADQLRAAAVRDGRDWLRHLPLNPTLGDVETLIASAVMVGVTAGIRLGRMYPAPGDREQ